MNGYGTIKYGSLGRSEDVSFEPEDSVGTNGWKILVIRV